MQRLRAESQRHRFPGCQTNGSGRDGPRTGPRRGNAGENAGQHSLGPVAITTLDTVGVADVSLLCARRVPHALHVERLRRDSGASFGRRFVPSATTVQKEMERNRGVNDPVSPRRFLPRAARNVLPRHGSRCRRGASTHAFWIAFRTMYGVLSGGDAFTGCAPIHSLRERLVRLKASLLSSALRGLDTRQPPPLQVAAVGAQEHDGTTDWIPDGTTSQAQDGRDDRGDGAIIVAPGFVGEIPRPFARRWGRPLPPVVFRLAISPAARTGRRP
jgi:hypothetical protein